MLEGFGFGAALLAMFMRVGGGIFTKAADVGADLVGKVEQGIPEDDPRNAATIADNVGDNVGDCAGMAADLFESYAVTLVAALILGKAAFGDGGPGLPADRAGHRRRHRDHRHLPHPAAAHRPQRHDGHQPRLLHLRRDLGRAGARSPRSSTCPARSSELDGVDAGDRRATPATATRGCSPSAPWSSASCWPRSIQLLTGYFTETNRAPGAGHRQDLAHRPGDRDPGRHHASASSRPSTPRCSSAPAVYGAFLLGGGSVMLALFAVALAGTGLLTTVGVIVAMDTFGPISDNAQGIAEMSGDIDEEGARVLTDLDAVGNTTKAITKGIAIATAVLAATALFGSFTDSVKTAVADAGAELDDAIRDLQYIGMLNVADPNNLVGLIIGAAVVFLFSGLAINAVSRAAGAVVFEVRRQFREIPGIMDGTEQPGVRQGRRHLHPRLAARAGDPRPAGRPGADRRRLRPRRRRARRRTWPARSRTGTLMAVFLANSGGAWDNAKKMVEDGAYGGKGSRRPTRRRSSATPSATRSRTPPARRSTR